MNNAQRQTRYSVLILFLVVLAMAGYAVPWVAAPSASLTLGANDLAEWASLHPQARATSPSMLASLLLRFPIVCLAFITAFSVPPRAFRSRLWWGGACYAGLLVTLALPPLEFFGSARNDKNYQQQIMLAGIAILGSGLGLSGILARWRPFVAPATAAMGMVASIEGLRRAYMLMRDFLLPVQVGAGGIIMIVILAIIMIVGWRLNIKQGSMRDNQQAPAL